MSFVGGARVQNLAFLAFAFAILTFAMFPGRFDGDAFGSYQQAQNFYFTDASSVWNAILIGGLSDLAPGPGPMFVVQLAIWTGGLLLFTDALIAAGHPITGQAISLAAVSPLLSFDFFDVQKDALLSGLLIVLIAIGARRMLLRPRYTLIGAAVGAFVFLLALDSRHNALFALVPIWFLVWPVRSLKLRPALAAVAAGAGVFAVAHLALTGINHGPFRSDRAHFSYSVLVYDLAGVSVRTHQDASEGRLPEFLAQAQQCYSPHEWDAFQGGACEATGLAAQKLMMDRRTRRDLTLVWSREILQHPVAYGAHRARFFGCLISVGCQRKVQLMSANWWPRPWDAPHMRVSTTARAIGALGKWMWKGPLGAGWLWLLVLTGELGAGVWALRRRGFRPLPYLTVVVSGAGLAYLASFAVGGISDQMRYLHPVIFMAVTALPLAFAAAAAGLHRRAGDPDQGATTIKLERLLTPRKRERRQPAEPA